MSVVAERLEKAWDPDKHPRDKDGQFLGATGVDIGMLESPPLPSLPYRPPPDPGTGGGGGGQSSFEGITNTQLGDAVELALQEQLGMNNLHPGRRQGPLDLGVGRYGFEVKAVTTAAKEFKAKPKKAEVASKVKEAKARGLKPGMMIVVVEPNGTAMVYWKNGIGAYRVSSSMNYSGTIKVNLA
jgi:hypothetical protein